MQKNDIAAYSVTEKLRDGRPVIIRAIRPDDRSRVVDTLLDVSSDSFYRRTFSPKRALSDQELTRLTEVDFQDVVALVAVMKETDGERIVGGGRYVRMGPAPADGAEVAFLIDDPHQGLGIGSRIFRHLVSIARASGVPQFEADVLPSNEGMLRVFERSGLPVARTPAPDVVHIKIELAATEDSKSMTEHHSMSGGTA